MLRKLTLTTMAIWLACAVRPAFALPERTASAVQPASRAAEPAKDTVMVHFSRQPMGQLAAGVPCTNKFGVQYWRYGKPFMAQGDQVMQNAPIYRMKINYNGSEDVSFLKTMGPFLHELNLNDFEINDKQAKLFKWLPNLQDVNADHSEISDEGVKELLVCKKLERLSLCRGDITSKALTTIGQMSGLKDLRISHNTLSDASIANLANLHQLAHLGLGATRISDAGVVHLKALTHLRELDLSRNEKITNKVFDTLLNFKELRDLDLGETSVTEMSAPMLKNLHSLKLLTISYRLFSETGLKHLHAALPGVSIVEYNEGRVPLDVFEPLH